MLAPSASQRPSVLEGCFRMNDNETIAEAVASGDELRILYATRRAVARDIDGCESGRDMAALSNRMIDLCERITELEKQQKPKRKTTLDAVRKIRK